MITSPRNSIVSAALALRTRSRRERARRFLVEGPSTVAEAVLAGAAETIFVTPEGPAPPDAAPTGDAPEQHVVAPAVMRRLAGTVTPQGPVAVCRFVDVPLEEIDAADGPIVVLVEVRDPGNAGTILRTAHAAGCGGVIVSARSVDVYNEKAARASAGGLFHVPVAREVGPGVAADFLRARGATLLAAAADGSDDLYDDALGRVLAGPVAVLFGNEAHGLDGALLERADRTVRIPMREGAESLNLAAAAAVILFEAARRRRSAAGNPA